MLLLTLGRGAPSTWGAQSLVLTSFLAPLPFAPWSQQCSPRLDWGGSVFYTRV